MEMKEIKENDISICAVSGEINISTSPELRKFFDRLIRQDAKKVIVDFAHVSYIDSSGLATLIEMLQRIKKIQGIMKLCGMSFQVKNIFEVTKLDTIFTIVNDLETAKKNF